jgi:hypothetical protein
MKKVKLVDLLAFKANVGEVFAVAIILALGINVLSSGFVSFFDLSNATAMGVGVFLVFVGVVFIVKKIKPANSGVFTFEAVVCAERDSKELLPVHDYKFASEICDYVAAICSENKAIERIWTREPIGYGLSFDEGVPVKKTPKSNKLLVEAVEYFALDSLSLHLSSYFENNESLSEDELTTLKRKDIPSVLLENRFLELFSKPMEEREAFLHSQEADGKHFGEVVSAYGKDGAIFEHFDLILPKGSSITREGDSSISIKTKRFKFNILPVFEGMNGGFPPAFSELYLGRKFMDVQTFSVKLILSVEFSMGSLLTAKGWGYYWWLDSFLESIEQSCSANSFLHKIAWSQNSALIHMMNVKGEQQLKVGGQD